MLHYGSRSVGMGLQKDRLAVWQHHNRKRAGVQSYLLYCRTVFMSLFIIFKMREKENFYFMGSSSRFRAPSDGPVLKYDIYAVLSD